MRLVLSLSLCLLTGGIALADSPRPHPETAAFGRQPAATRQTAAALRGSITTSNLPLRFQQGASRTLDQALTLRPGAKDRNDAVVREPALGGGVHAWVSFAGQSGQHQRAKYVSVTPVDGRSSLATKTTHYQTNGSMRELWRDVIPVGQGYHLEQVSLSRGQKAGNSVTTTSTVTKHFLVDGAGRRVMAVSADQALDLKYGGLIVRGHNLAVRNGSRVVPLTPQ